VTDAFFLSPSPRPSRRFVHGISPAYHRCTLSGLSRNFSLDLLVFMRSMTTLKFNPTAGTRTRRHGPGLQNRACLSLRLPSSTIKLFLGFFRPSTTTTCSVRSATTIRHSNHMQGSRAVSCITSWLHVESPYVTPPSP